MGTETLTLSIVVLYHKFKDVKLNNPQMGTETRYKSHYLVCQLLTFVKLNNPQMGTETVINIQREHFIVVN